MECFRLIFDHLVWIEHQFLSSIRDSRKAGSLWGMMRGVGGVRKSIQEFRKRFPRKRPALFKSDLQHSTKTMHQSTTASFSQTIWERWESTQFLSLPIVQTLLSVTFGFSLSSEAVVMRQLRRWKRLWRGSLTRSHNRTSMGPSSRSFRTVQQVHCSRRRLLWMGLVFHVCIINKSAHTKKFWKLIVCPSYIYIYIYTKMYSHIYMYFYWST